MCCAESAQWVVKNCTAFSWPPACEDLMHRATLMLSSSDIRGASFAKCGRFVGEPLSKLRNLSCKTRH